MKVAFFFFFFCIIFMTKLQGVFDVSLAVALILAAWSIITCKRTLSLNLLPYLAFLFIITAYAGFVSLVYGAEEYIFFLKFGRTLLLFFLLYYVLQFMQPIISYHDFCKYFIVMVFIHAIIIVCAITIPEFRHVLYSFTGYVPRGPEWSRSPGLTISFNATAIVHIAGLWLLLSKTYWQGIRRWAMVILIVFSLIFLGRFISFLGLGIIFLFLLFTISWKKKAVVVVFLLLLVLPLMQWVSSLDYSHKTAQGQILMNYHHFADVLFNMGEDGGADSYYHDSLADHIYFSNEWNVLLFGNSQAGHVGLQGGDGDTDSDLGVINSINANGFIITVLIYVFYCLLIWEGRKGDGMTIALVAFLSMALSFKETGLFTAHATPLLFILFFYALHPGQFKTGRWKE